MRRYNFGGLAVSTAHSGLFLTIPLFQAAVVGQTEKPTVLLTLRSLCAHSGAASAAPIAPSEWPQGHRETHALAKNRRCTTCLGAKRAGQSGPADVNLGVCGRYSGMECTYVARIECTKSGLPFGRFS